MKFTFKSKCSRDYIVTLVVTNITSNIKGLHIFYIAYTVLNKTAVCSDI
jgi:hypothetical protein